MDSKDKEIERLKEIIQNLRKRIEDMLREVKK